MLERPSAAAASALIAALRERLHGSVVAPDDPEYGPARRVWNAAVDRRPLAIARCADADDVVLALKISAQRAVAVTIRGGGHNVAGRSMNDDALLLDLSQLRSVMVNAPQKIATVQGGALWSDVDAATSVSGLATTGGLVSTTGVGGFTLGGGTGWLMRRYGLACDNLIGANVVLADGRFVRATALENTDLFWGLRGGAGGLGVVTSFDFQLHEVRDVVAGLIVHEGANAGAVLRRFRDVALQAPDEFCALAVLANAPPLPFLDPVAHGRPVVILAVCWCGDPAMADQAFAPLRSVCRPLAEHIGRMPYKQWQTMQDPSAPSGRYYYWKTANFRALDDRVIDDLAAAVVDLPSPQSEIHVQHMGGAVARAPAGTTAFAQRDAEFFVNIIGVVPTATELPSTRERVRALHRTLAPGALPTMLPNFTDHDDGDVAAAAGNADRIRELRRRYDPAAIFGRS